MTDTTAEAFDFDIHRKLMEYTEENNRLKGLLAGAGVSPNPDPNGPHQPHGGWWVERFYPGQGWAVCGFAMTADEAQTTKAQNQISNPTEQFRIVRWLTTYVLDEPKPWTPAVS